MVGCALLARTARYPPAAQRDNPCTYDGVIMSGNDPTAEVLSCVSQLSIFDSLCLSAKHSACAYALAVKSSQENSDTTSVLARCGTDGRSQPYLGLIAQPEAWATWGHGGRPDISAWRVHCAEYIKSQRTSGSAGSQLVEPVDVDATLAVLASCTPAHIHACTAAVHTLCEYAWGQTSAWSPWLSSVARAALTRAAGGCWPVAQQVLAYVVCAQQSQPAASCLVCSVVLPNIAAVWDWPLQDLLGVGMVASASDNGGEDNDRGGASMATAESAHDSKRALQWCMVYHPAALFWAAGRCFAAWSEPCACCQPIIEAGMRLAASLANLPEVVKVCASTSVRDACSVVHWQPMELGIAAAADLQAAVGVLLLQCGNSVQRARGLQLLACRWRLLGIRDAVLGVPSEPAEWQPLASAAQAASPDLDAAHELDAPAEFAPASFPLFDPLNFRATTDLQPVPQRQQRRLAWHDALHRADAQLSAHAHSTIHSTRHVGWWQGPAMLVEWVVLAAATSGNLTVGLECALRDLRQPSPKLATHAPGLQQPQPLQLPADAVAQLQGVANFQLVGDVPKAVQVAWNCCKWAAWHCLLWGPGLDGPAFLELVGLGRGAAQLPPAVRWVAEEMSAGFVALLDAMPGLEHVKVCARLDQLAVSSSGDDTVLAQIRCITQHAHSPGLAQAAAGRLVHLSCLAVLDGARQPPAVLLAALEGICTCAGLCYTASDSEPESVLPAPVIPEQPPAGSPPPTCWSATCKVLVHFALQAEMPRMALYDALLDAIAACALCADDAKLCAAWLALVLAVLARQAALPLRQVWCLPPADAELWACANITDVGLPAMCKAAQSSLQRYLAAVARRVSGVTHPVFRLLLAWAGRPAKFLAVDQYVQMQTQMRDAAVLLLPLALDTPGSTVPDWPAPALAKGVKRTPRLLLHEMSAAGIRAWMATCAAAWDAWAASIAQAGDAMTTWDLARWVSCGSRCATQLLVRLYLATTAPEQGSTAYHSHIRGALLAAGSVLQAAETSAAFTHSIGPMADSKLYQKAVRHVADARDKSLHRKRRRQGADGLPWAAAGQALPASAAAVHPLAWMSLAATAKPALTSRNQWVLALAAADGESGNSYADMDDFFADS